MTDGEKIEIILMCSCAKRLHSARLKEIWWINKGSRKDRFDVSDVFEIDIIEEMKRLQYEDPGKMFYGINLTKNRVLDLLDKNQTAATIFGYTLQPKKI